MTETAENINYPQKQPEKKRIRIAVALVYFSMGLCFSSWACRIPDIKTTLNLSDALFGSILFALPVGQFLMMPVSGKHVMIHVSGKPVTVHVSGKHVTSL